MLARWALCNALHAAARPVLPRTQILSCIPARACTTTIQPVEQEQERAAKSFLAKAKGLKHSPKKLTLLCRELAGLNLTEAFAQMSLSDKRIGKTRLRQLISSAWYMAEEHHQLDPRDLVIKEAWVGKQEFLKRIRYHSKGRAGTVHKPRCMVTLKLEEEAPHMVGTSNHIKKHGKHEGLIRSHWKKWKKKYTPPKALESNEQEAVN
eukprot:TRINITY_DN23251_c0_g1_i2.p1 TRINITY_DN23251_c0_g1~~TRINITY_DN23251_c0_g1_i2.p1  ORF type:complete len:207 (+),score=46.90 TRINITY_DN23251_c0_g1_i2:252-872(+)